MSELLIPDGYCQINHIWQSANFASGGASTSVGFKLEVSQTLAEVAVHAYESWALYLKEQLDDDIALARIDVVTELLRVTHAVNEAGENNIQSPPPNTSILVTAETAARGRRGRGRNYWPGLVQESSVDERGAMPSIEVAAYQALFDAWLGQMRTDIGAMVILQRDTPGQVTAPFDPPPEVQTLIVRDLVATQRRRLRK